MGRYRPPAPQSSAYITADGAEQLRAELHQLWKVERPQVTAIVHEAAKNGDRSENGDYIYGKRRMREIDSRVRYLSKRLEILTVVDRIPEQTDKVFFGAWITLEDDEGKENCYRIVGPDELNPAKNWISMDSPLSRAAIGKHLDDEFEFQSPQGLQRLCITKISYYKD
jgi:transcription elongation factor GreB